MAVRPTLKQGSRNKINSGAIILLFSFLGLAGLSVILTDSEVQESPVFESGLLSAPVMILYGANQYSNADQTAAVRCSREKVTFALTDNPHYTVQIILSTPLQASATPHVISLGEGAKLNVDLLDMDGTVYRSFSVAEGSAELTRKQGRLSAILYDGVGEQLFINARWSCAEPA